MEANSVVMPTYKQSSRSKNNKARKKMGQVTMVKDGLTHIHATQFVATILALCTIGYLSPPVETKQITTTDKQLQKDGEPRSGLTPPSSEGAVVRKKSTPAIRRKTQIWKKSQAANAVVRAAAFAMNAARDATFAVEKMCVFMNAVTTIIPRQIKERIQTEYVDPAVKHRLLEKYAAFVGKPRPPFDLFGRPTVHHERTVRQCGAPRATIMCGMCSMSKNHRNCRYPRSFVTLIQNGHDNRCEFNTECFECYLKNLMRKNGGYRGPHALTSEGYYDPDGNITWARFFRWWVGDAIYECSGCRKCKRPHHHFLEVLEQLLRDGALPMMCPVWELSEWDEPESWWKKISKEVLELAKRPLRTRIEVFLKPLEQLPPRKDVPPMAMVLRPDRKIVDRSVDESLGQAEDLGASWVDLM